MTNFACEQHYDPPAVLKYPLLSKARGTPLASVLAGGSTGIHAKVSDRINLVALDPNITRMPLCW